MPVAQPACAPAQLCRSDAGASLRALRVPSGTCVPVARESDRATCDAVLLGLGIIRLLQTLDRYVTWNPHRARRHPQGLSVGGDGGDVDEGDRTTDRLGRPERIVTQPGRSQIVLAVEVDSLVREARRLDGIVEFVPQVGDFVATDEPLYNLYGGAARMSDEILREAVAFGSERTPNWEDFVHVACNEIRACGAGSMQIPQRMRACRIRRASAARR